MRLRLLAGATLVALAACDDMSHQPRYDSYEGSTIFPNGTSLQTPPAGTVSRDALAKSQALGTRPPMTMTLLARGKERFGIYCTPCHDAAGYGYGTVPSRGFPQPPSYHIPRLRNAASGYFVDVMTNGHGVMYSYSDRVAPADRWAIAAYIRALQLSQHADVSALPEADRRQLERVGR